MNPSDANMPSLVSRIVNRGFARWASDNIEDTFRSRFHREQIPVAGARHVRVWGVQVDDERELPGHERTQIPDEDLWEIQLVALDGTRYEVDSSLVAPID